MDSLVAGYRKFRSIYYEQNHELFEALARDGQSPKTLLIGCSDSRVDPAVIFWAQPGDMFVVRNVASLVPPYAPDGHLHGTSAAIEFAARSLKVEHIIVMGHSGCGGVGALFGNKEGAPSDFFADWISVARQAHDRALLRALSLKASHGEMLKICEQEVVAASMTNLMSFPWVRERVEAGEMKIHGLWFNVHDGELYILDPVSNSFVTMT